jgi:hypothetical protein
LAVVFAGSVPLVKKKARAPVTRNELVEAAPSMNFITSVAESWVAKVNVIDLHTNSRFQTVASIMATQASEAGGRSRGPFGRAKIPPSITLIWTEYIARSQKTSDRRSSGHILYPTLR